MMTHPQRLIAAGLLFAVCSSSPSCNSKKQPEGASAVTSEIHEKGSEDRSNPPDNHLEELMKLPDAERKMDSYVFSHISEFPEEVFDLETPEIRVKKPIKDLFEVTATFSGTTKTDTYRNPLPLVVFDEEKKSHKEFIITEKLDSKGTRKQSVIRFEVRYGPMRWGRNPDKVIWNWSPPKTDDKEIEEYESGSYHWRTAEYFKINSEGSASSDPYIAIRGTPGYKAALAKFPSLAKEEAEAEARRKRQEEERLLTEKLIEHSNEEVRKGEERKRKLRDESLKQ